jgi:hypothetical protein
MSAHGRLIARYVEVAVYKYISTMHLKVALLDANMLAARALRVSWPTCFRSVARLSWLRRNEQAQTPPIDRCTRGEAPFHPNGGSLEKDEITADKLSSLWFLNKCLISEMKKLRLTAVRSGKTVFI